MPRRQTRSHTASRELTDQKQEITSSASLELLQSLVISIVNCILSSHGVFSASDFENHLINKDYNASSHKVCRPETTVSSKRNKLDSEFRMKVLISTSEGAVRVQRILSLICETIRSKQLCELRVIVLDDSYLVNAAEFTYSLSISYDVGFASTSETPAAHNIQLGIPQTIQAMKSSMSDILRQLEGVSTGRHAKGIRKAKWHLVTNNSKLPPTMHHSFSEILDSRRQLSGKDLCLSNTFQTPWHSARISGHEGNTRTLFLPAQILDGWTAAESIQSKVPIAGAASTGEEEATQRELSQKEVALALLDSPAPSRMMRSPVTDFLVQNLKQPTMSIAGGKEKSAVQLTPQREAVLRMTVSPATLQTRESAFVIQSVKTPLPQAESVDDNCESDARGTTPSNQVTLRSAKSPAMLQMRKSQRTTRRGIIDLSSQSEALLRSASVPSQVQSEVLRHNAVILQHEAMRESTDIQSRPQNQWSLRTESEAFNLSPQKLVALGSSSSNVSRRLSSSPSGANQSPDFLSPQQEIPLQPHSRVSKRRESIPHDHECLSPQKELRLDASPTPTIFVTSFSKAPRLGGLVHESKALYDSVESQSDGHELLPFVTPSLRASRPDLHAQTLGQNSLALENGTSAVIQGSTGLLPLSSFDTHEQQGLLSQVESTVSERRSFSPDPRNVEIPYDGTVDFQEAPPSRLAEIRRLGGPENLRKRGQATQALPNANDFLQNLRNQSSADSHTRKKLKVHAPLR